MCTSLRAVIFRYVPISTCLLSGLWGCSKASGPTISGTVTLSAVPQTVRTSKGLGTTYWSWSPTYGDQVAGTEDQIRTLAPFVMRVGGSTNDMNLPDKFDDAQMDAAMTYLRAIGADMILQVPVLGARRTNSDGGAGADADSDAGSDADAGFDADAAAGSSATAGAPNGPAMAAAMVSYANVQNTYGVKYFSIGNEPDLYATATGSSGIAGYTPADYCADVTNYVAAMKAVDPTIKIVGPDLSWKYQSGANDWLTPILQTCGSLFDIVAIHRYPIVAALTTVAAAAADASNLRGMIAHLQSILQATGNAGKPLAITECNITWDGNPTNPVLPASPGTVPAGLWAADAFGVGLESGLWATVFWSTRESWTLGLFANRPGTPKPQPVYWALDLFAEHFGTTLLSVSSAPSKVSAYASRNQTENGTQIIAVNWNDVPAVLTFKVDDLATTPKPPTFTLPALSVAAIEIPDTGAASALVYGETQHQADLPPQPLH
ncbi:MAG: glycosyl hydrolase [Polyangia bacterium]